MPVIETIIDAELRIFEGGATEEDLRALGIADQNMYELLRANHEPLSLIAYALGLLKGVNPPSGDAYAGKVFVALERIRAQEADPEKRRKLRRMQDNLLDDLEDRRVTSIVLRRLPEMEPGHRGAYYRYLQRAAVGDERVIEKLKAMAGDEKNPLHDDPRLAETLQTVTTGPSAEFQRLVRQLKSYYEDPASTLHQNPALKEVLEKLPSAERALETARRAAEAERRAREAKQFAEASRREKARWRAEEENREMRKESIRGYAGALKKHVNAFRFKIVYRGPDAKERYYSLWLGVPEPPKTTCSRCLTVRISKSQAKKIVEHLGESGFLWRGILYRRRLLPPPKKPHYRLRVDVERDWGTSYEDIVVGPKLIERLESLKTVCEGEAAEALGRLIKPLKAEVMESEE